MTTASLQDFLFVAATNDVPAGVYSCACVPSDLLGQMIGCDIGTRNTYLKKRSAIPDLKNVLLRSAAVCCICITP